jgi:hypothetical protein
VIALGFIVTGVALLGGAAAPALAQATADDLAASVSAIATHTTTDADGNRISHVTLSGTFGDASFVLDEKQMKEVFGNNDGGMTYDTSKLASLYAKQAKDSLGVTDEEWKVLAPKIAKIRSLLAQLSGRGGGRRGPGTELAVSWRALEALLKNKEAPADQFKAALQSVSAAETKVKGELAAARKDLRELVTLRQEAMLVRQEVLE